MHDHDAPRGGGKVAPLRPKTIDDGEIRLGPVRVEPLTAAQEAQAVELLTALFAAALRRQRSTPLRRRQGSRFGFSSGWAVLVSVLASDLASDL